MNNACTQNVILIRGNCSENEPTTECCEIADIVRKHALFSILVGVLLIIQETIKHEYFHIMMAVHETCQRFEHA